MTEQSAQERIAALQARRAQSSPTSVGDPVSAAAPSASQKRGTGRASGTATRKPTSSARIVTAGASAMSFGAMIVAMGPLLQSTVDSEIAADAAASVAGVGSAIAPNVVIEVVPNPAALALTDGAASTEFGATPNKPSPTTAAPTQTAPPQTAPPQTAPPQTAPPPPPPTTQASG